MQINLFNGGLSTRLLPHLIQANEAVECVNVDTSKGSLVPLKAHKDLNRKVASNIYNFKGLWIDTDENRDYVEYQEKLFYSNGVGRPQWSPDGARFFNVGIDGPANAPVLSPLMVLNLTEFEVFNEPFYRASNGFYNPANIEDANLGPDEVQMALLYAPLGVTERFEGVWNFKVLLKHKQLDAYSLWDVKDFGLSNPNQSLAMTLSKRRFTVYGIRNNEENLQENYRKMLLDPNQGTLPSGVNYVYLRSYTDKNSAITAVNKIEFGVKVEYAAIWTDSESRRSIEYFNFTFTEEMSSGKLLYGIKVKKKEGYKLQLYRNSKKVPLVEDDEYYYDGKATTLEDLSSVLEEADSVRYCYTYYSSATGSESAPSPVGSVSFEGDFSTVAVKVNASEDAQVDEIRVYRFGAGYTDWVLLEKLENKSQTFTDTKPSVVLNGEPLPTLLSNPAPTGLKYLTTSNAMLFGALEDKLYYSNVGDPFFWDSFSFIDFDNTITGIGATPNGLLVFTSDKTFIVTGNSPETLSKYLLSAAVGCVLHKSIQTLENSILWLSKDGLYTSTGGSLVALSRDKLGDFDFKNPRCSEIKGERYFLSFQYGTMIVDMRYSLTFTLLKDRFKGLHVSESEVFGCNDSNDLVKLFAGDTYLPVEYTSPQYADGSLSTVKVYTKLNIYATGELSLTVLIDGKEVATSKLAEGYNEVKLPQSATRGYFIQFKVEGQGELKEVEYVVEGSQNG